MGKRRRSADRRIHRAILRIREQEADDPLPRGFFDRAFYRIDREEFYRSMRGGGGAGSPGRWRLPLVAPIAALLLAAVVWLARPDPEEPERVSPWTQAPSATPGAAVPGASVPPEARSRPREIASVVPDAPVAGSVDPEIGARASGPAEPARGGLSSDERERLERLLEEGPAGHEEIAEVAHAAIERDPELLPELGHFFVTPAIAAGPEEAAWPVTLGSAIVVDVVASSHASGRAVIAGLRLIDQIERRIGGDWIDAVRAALARETLRPSEARLAFQLVRNETLRRNWAEVATLVEDSLARDLPRVELALDCIENAAGQHRDAARRHLGHLTDEIEAATEREGFADQWRPVARRALDLLRR